MSWPRRTNGELLLELGELSVRVSRGARAKDLEQPVSGKSRAHVEGLVPLVVRHYDTSMAADLDSLFQDALSLPTEERADLIARLLTSLEPPQPSTELTDEEWVWEIERRARAALSGATGVPWEEVRDIVRRRLRG